MKLFPEHSAEQPFVCKTMAFPDEFNRVIGREKFLTDEGKSHLVLIFQKRNSHHFFEKTAEITFFQTCDFGNFRQRNRTPVIGTDIGKYRFQTFQIFCAFCGCAWNRAGGKVLEQLKEKFKQKTLEAEQPGIGRARLCFHHLKKQITASYPELRYMNTESECGDGQNTWEHMEYIFMQMWNYFRHGAERYTYWNLALKEGGVSTWGWSQNSLCTIDPENGKLTLRPEFYLMKHFSHFIQKGAKYLGIQGHWTANTMAFENPDHSLVLVVGSNMNRERIFRFRAGEVEISAVIEAHSIHTFVIESLLPAVH